MSNFNSFSANAPATGNETRNERGGFYRDLSDIEAELRTVQKVSRKENTYARYTRIVRSINRGVFTSLLLPNYYYHQFSDQGSCHDRDWDDQLPPAM